MAAPCCGFFEFVSAVRVEFPEQPETIEQISANATAAIADEEFMQRLPHIMIPYLEVSGTE
jgi:hypothetical protein